MDRNFLDRVTEIIDKERVLTNEPMSKHTTFRIGGPVDYFVCPENIEEVQKVVCLCNEMDMPFYLLGNGSNLLVGDKGYRGVIIRLYKQMDKIEVSGTKIKAQAGALLVKVANEACKNGLTGLEFAGGIPGTLGGAVVMNAGAYGGEMKDVLEEVTVLTKEGEILTLNKEELELGYRTSIIGRKGYIALEVVLRLKEKNADEIRAYMNELREKRVTKQPLEYASAGSTFKRPEGHFAGQLIEQAGLRGFQVGDAQVSEKHCGFVINRGQATAKDVMDLMREVSAKVEEKFGVTLEPEVKRLGEF
ncbi:UDP-N-acetylmuramate dehydrogenase [Faecalimonas canis]